MTNDGISDDFYPWDWLYYSEKRRQKEHELNEEEVKSYFSLDQMVEAAFYCANKLFGLSFQPVSLPLYHKDCKAWEVTKNGRKLHYLLVIILQDPRKDLVHGVVHSNHKPNFLSLKNQLF